MRDVLISGAGIAGPALAHWLHRAGYRPTVVERAPAVRPGGQAVDFRGAAHLRMLRRMGVLEEIRRRATRPGPLHLIDAAGRPVVTLPAAFTGGDVEIRRGDLTGLLYELTRHDVEYLFDDTLTALREHQAGVEVTFARAAPRRFDLVVGADGLHSTVRALVFGPESRYVRHSGYQVAIFTAPARAGVPDVEVLYNEPGRGLVVVPGAEPGTCSVQCVFLAEPPPGGARDTDRRRAQVVEAYAGTGWLAAPLVAAAARAGDFYADSISLVTMDRHTSGRVALIGDAGYGATVGGMGAGMGMISAYVLAGELAAAGGDHRRALPAYQHRIAGYARRCQKVAAGAGRFLAPPTGAAIRNRNRSMRVLTSPVLGGLLNRLTTRAANSIRLPDYPIGGAAAGGATGVDLTRA
jgi:2-polyprenyl-6-methoxyphenol hydroxylase-like FAD-dependent oxidoreductase